MFNMTAQKYNPFDIFFLWRIVPNFKVFQGCIEIVKLLTKQCRNIL